MVFGHHLDVNFILMQNLIIIATIIGVIIIPAYRLHLLYKKNKVEKTLSIWDFCDITAIPLYWYLAYLIISSIRY